VDATAVFRDELVREDGLWGVARHEVTVDPGMMVGQED
jgi:hypothetical protein